jgi:hypothetical protein
MRARMMYRLLFLRLLFLLLHAVCALLYFREPFSYTITALTPFLLDSFKLLLVGGLYRSQAMLPFELMPSEQGGALKEMGY